MHIQALVNLTSKAWALPILAAFHRGVPGRQAQLLKATSASRNAFAQSMQHLLHLELVERNAGHGHPLRPEFRVTSRGAAMAEMAHRILSQVREADHLLLRKSWTLPVLAVVREPQFFGGLRQQLVPVTDRALSLALRGLEAKNWVERVPLQELRPMRPSYSAVGVGLAIAQDLNRYLSRQ